MSRAAGKAHSPSGGKARDRAARGLGWKRRLIVIAIFLAILLWYAHPIANWASAFNNSLKAAFGWGGVILILLLASLFWLLSKEAVRNWLRRFLGYFRWWRWWLGGLSFFLAAFGLLAFFGLGGSFGLAIIQGLDAQGALRVLALLIIGGLFVATRPTLRLLGALVWVLLRSLGHFLATLGAGLWGVFQRFVLQRTMATPPPSPSPQPTPTPTPSQPVQEETPPTPAKPTGLPRWLPPFALGRKDKAKIEEKPKEATPIITASGWQLPPITLLDLAPEVEMRPVDSEKRARLIEEALSSYGVEARVMQINVGPTVTQFGVEPGWDRKYKEVRVKDKNGQVHVHQDEVSRTRVKVDRISSLANDLALALSATSIRIEAPVPGKPLVGIEVPNTTAGVVALRGVLESPAYHRLKAKSRLSIGLGKGAGGEGMVADLAKMPHLLVAGATGSGKTVFLNSVICGLLMANTPDDLRFIMIDPKRVELVTYNPVPHMATPVLVETEKAVETLRWLNQEMDERYRRFASVGARHIEDYNKKHYPPFPYLVLVVDELADLMMAAFDEVEQSLCRLAQLSRATGIHLVVATQRPSVDVVTGLIKANFPTRLSFAVTSQVDSRTILDTVGAEKLLGRGDMLYLPTDAAKPKRLQGCYVSDPEMERLVAFWGKQRPSRMTHLVSPEGRAVGAPVGEPADPLLEAARRLAQEYKQVSASFLQRRLQIGYNRAVQLMDALEREKTVKGPGESGRSQTGG